jgi:dTDP-4-dehydrorhamnose 3,5-epimerase-like enzyme
MIICKKLFEECFVFKTSEFRDSRGYFTGIFNQNIFNKKLKKI